MSLLPMSVLYAVASFIKFLLLKVFKYRKKVVYYNLKLSFPTYSEQEIYLILNEFYTHLSELIVESIKSFSISTKELISRVDFPTDFVIREFGEDKSSIALLGHIGNWEWAGMAYSAKVNSMAHIVYHKLSDPQFDNLMKKTRSKNGAQLSSMEETLRTFVKNRNQIICTCLVADQNPNPEGAYWTDFLERKTAFFRGPAKLAQKFNMPVYYAEIVKPKKGYYKLTLELLIKDPKVATEDEIIETYVKRLEKDIKSNPSLWLWSHRRWKHKYEDFN
jgi:Kdo2-lipid IVA lauroyltransferase/acyltransferase